MSTVVDTTQACCSMCFKKVPQNEMTKDRWWSDVEDVGDLSFELIEDEEVAMVDGVFESAFGALGDMT
nr:hypothetical protein [Tanacetum cinerariifolium]